MQKFNFRVNLQLVLIFFSLFKKLALILGVATLLACQSFSPEQKKLNSPLEWKTQGFIPHSNWVGMNVDFQYPDQIRKQIEQIGKFSLKNRGEAHITIITPPEFENIKSKISIEELNELVKKQLIQESKFKTLCIGRGLKNDPTRNKMMETYFLVVESTPLFEFRRMVFKTWTERGGDPQSFAAEKYYPHITLGFTEKDLHESDGVIKSKDSCYFELSDANGNKL